ncbi:two-component system, LytT family, sensor kinase [Actinosynnema pretiosum]|uniref:sensor histidine kinase n=1 Tax=Actinosynnema pretiosum TaxID=42197 RepID=UPI0020A4AB5C|nr:histidine kinase [Actinosynnema pretiosum]MCP2093440.1 two-component system, LytT family, sensor kinase [Actinosynnema pretiosum]
MDGVRDLLTERAVLGVIATLAVLGLFVMLCRARRVSTSVEDAVMDMLHRMSKASADLREGLTAESADKATPHLREMLRCVAVGITDDVGGVLSWDGGAADHYQLMRGHIEQAIGEVHKEHVEHRKLDCDLSGPCPMHSAVIVPLIVESEVAGTLIVISGVPNKRQIRMAEETARFVSTQLELEVLQKSRQALAQAEVRALRAQISPHFVYNALNTISSLIRTDPVYARELLQEFAEFTRYSFRTDGFFTTLSDELTNIHRYLTIEQARYGARLEVRLRIAPEVLQVVLPFLCLQPLVENAVRHGLAKKPGGGMLTITAEDNGAEALISVEDDGVGMDPERLFEDLKDAHQTGAHVGLGNINHRMRAVFGDDYALVVETAPEAGMKIILKVPKYRQGVRPNLTLVPPRVEETGEQAVLRA